MQKNLDSKNGYTSIEIEQFIPVVEKLTFFLFIEIGKNIGPKSDSGIFTIGAHVNMQLPIWKKI